MKQIQKLNYVLPWTIYLIAFVSYICFNLYEYSFFGVDRKFITPTCLLLISIAIYLSLSNIVGLKAALLYVLYWVILFIFIEYVYLVMGRFTHNEDVPKILDVVPFLIGINWLVLFFAVYSLSTFSSFLLKDTIAKRSKLIQILALDGFIIVLYALLLEPIGNHAGYFTWDTSQSPLLVFGLIPFRVFFEYFFGAALIMLPIRYWEVYKQAPLKIPFQKKASFPLYISWSLFAALAYWAFRKDISNVGVFGLVLVILITSFILYKRQDINKSISM